MAKQRRRGTGTVFRPKGAKSLWIRYYRNGKPTYENAKTVNRTEAQKILNDRLNAIGKGAAITVAPTRLTFDDALELYRADLKLNDKDAERPGVVKNLVPFFTGTREPLKKA